jgi:hypothetical protein
MALQGQTPPAQVVRAHLDERSPGALRARALPDFGVWLSAHRLEH